MMICEETARDLLAMLDNYLEINEFPNKRNKDELLTFIAQLEAQINNVGTVEILLGDKQ